MYSKGQITDQATIDAPPPAKNGPINGELNVSLKCRRNESSDTK